MKIIGAIVSSRPLVVLSLGMLLLVIILFYGIWLDAPKLITSATSPGGPILENGIVGLVTVILSIVFVAPLTAYFVEFLRERQLAPVRAALFNSAALQLKVAHDSHVNFLVPFLLMASHAATSLQLDIIKDTTTRFAEFGESVSARLSKRGTANPVSTPNAFPILVATAAGLTQLKSWALEHSRQMRLRLVHLDRTIGFMIPLFPEQAVVHLSGLRGEVMRYIVAVEELVELCGGTVPIVGDQFDPVRTNAAANAYLNAREIGEYMAKAADSCSPSTRSLVDLSALQAVRDDEIWLKEREFAQGVVDVMKIALQADQRPSPKSAG